MVKEAAHQRRLWKQLSVTPDSTWQLVLTFSASRIGTSDVLLLSLSSKDHNDILCFDRCEGKQPSLLLRTSLVSFISVFL